jgi:uncharacterized protein (DUF433 family)
MIFFEKHRKTCTFVLLLPYLKYLVMYIYKNIITLESGKRSGQPCIRGMRITVEDILRWLAAEMTFEDILHDFPELTKNDIIAALEFTALRQNRTVAASAVQ